MSFNINSSKVSLVNKEFINKDINYNSLDSPKQCFEVKYCGLNTLVYCYDLASLDEFIKLFFYFGYEIRPEALKRLSEFDGYVEDVYFYLADNDVWVLEDCENIDNYDIIEYKWIKGRRRYEMMDKYFKSIDVNISDIDRDVRYLVYLFNKIGLTTKFSCQGHDTHSPVSIIFNDSISKFEILDVADKILSAGGYMGEFHLWVRKVKEGEVEELQENWMFLLDIPFNEVDDRRMLIDKVSDNIRRIYESKTSIEKG